MESANEEDARHTFFCCQRRGWQQGHEKKKQRSMKRPTVCGCLDVAVNCTVSDGHPQVSGRTEQRTSAE